MLELPVCTKHLIAGEIGLDPYFTKFLVILFNWSCANQIL